MQFPKDLINAFKVMFTKVEDFFAPFAKQFTDTLFQQLVQIALTTIPTVLADPTLITDSAKREAALKQLEQEAIKVGIQASGTALLNALQVAYTHLNPDKAVVTPLGQPQIMTGGQ